MRYSKKAKKYIATLLLTVFGSQLLAPNVAMALTTGPTQPEVQAFEPVGTTDMVDMFSGDFVYNIPLLDVEGYPVNISYHGGVSMEQEASWVGLGWNINPGVINRTTRGVPDDFSGDVLSKSLHIKSETNFRIGLEAGLEAMGFGDPNPVGSASAHVGVDLNFNNYRGVSCDFTLGGGINVFKHVSAGVNIGIGSQTGADIDYNVSASMTCPLVHTLNKEMALGAGMGWGHGYNTRSGIKDQNFTFSVFGTSQYGQKPPPRSSSRYAQFSTSLSIGTTIPIATKNYIPVITNSSTMSAIYGRVKIGGELYWCYPYGAIKGMYSVLNYNNDGSRPSYGYMYMQNAPIDNSAILDFTRDKDGMFNANMKYLPPATMTYDIYSVSGQGTGGVFRPYRNDFGTVYDPSVDSRTKSNSFGIEAGLFPNLFELGVDYTHSGTLISSGPWQKYQRSFTKNQSGRIYENVYLKEGGELTSVSQDYLDAIGDKDPITPADANDLPVCKPGSMTARDPRGNLIHYNTAAEVSTPIYSYNDDSFTGGANPAKTTISRTSGGRKSHHISEIVQTQKDGRRYYYGIPAMNSYQKEATFSVSPPSSADLGAGLVAYTPGTDDNVTNGKGIDNYFSSTETPAYAHSYLLTSVLSSDFVDVTGDGPTDDDLGSYTKFNYSLKVNEYEWKAPYESGKAQYNPGFWSEPRDDKGSYVSGKREQWYMHSIESKNFIAEFYTSPRNDGVGSNGAASYKLDSLKLYNKHDRFINAASAVPIKTVFFVYDYSLCPGIPNNPMSEGKLTLRKIYFRYGNSQKSMLSPYQFSYGFNPAYDLASKDRWGNYKPNNTSWGNYEFPFVNQNDTSNDAYASAWSLTRINLPSGGVIQADYESDDYAYVQDKQAMEMFMIKGLGAGREYNTGTQLYWDKTQPLLYAYFDRCLSREQPALSFQQNYLTDLKCVYYNYNIKLAGKEKTREQIKGYAEAEEIGPCSDGIHGYIKFKAVRARGVTGALLNPACYTALNVSRYNVPQVIYPGSDPDESDLNNILLGLKEAFVELISWTRNPLIRFLVKNQAQEVNLKKSYVRLLNPGGHKKGGGQRVKKLLFFDSWDVLSGGNEPGATYGKLYYYGTAAMSSGVASYEPLIGGDENPFREPVKFSVTSGSHFPPNDPVDLYQETPIGETFYPPALVGYSKVTVTGLHADIGKSAQEMDMYTFYTAKDFPIKFYATAIDAHPPDHIFTIFRQTDTFAATQGYSLVLNDMHGKPKSVEHYAYNKRSSTLEPITQQYFYYKQAGSNELDNNAQCLVYESGVGIVSEPRKIGTETDITIDTREKKEFTCNFTVNANLNVSAIAYAVIPIPLVFPWYGEYLNQFHSATVTKITQQYGILDHVFTNNEGAKTTVTNELFDPETGQVVVTSVNNEFSDQEYSVNIPASWSYDGMSPAYRNIKYEVKYATMHIDSNHFGEINTTDNFHVGDELEVKYTYPGGNPQTVTAWFMDGKISTVGEWVWLSVDHYDSAKGYWKYHCVGKILPRFPTVTPGWDTGTTVTDVQIKVTRSGCRNQLNENIESYTMLGEYPVDGYNQLRYSVGGLINLKAQTFSDSSTRIINRYIINPDTINPYAIGERGVYRMLNDYAYVKDRNYYGTTARTAGLFHKVNTLFSSAGEGDGCIQFPYRYLAPDPTLDAHWTVARTITKWSPNGKEVENLDAIGNYSTAVYRYDNELPVAVASNAMQGDIYSDGFEDYSLLKPATDLVNWTYSPIEPYLSLSSFAPPLYSLLNLNNPGGVSILTDEAHTGKHSLFSSVPGGNISDAYVIELPVFSYYSLNNNKYNTYYATGTPITPLNEYLPFNVVPGKKYILSYWIKQQNPTANTTNYALSNNWGVQIAGGITHVNRKSNIIEGWQQVEATFAVPLFATSARLTLPVNYYVDDIRLYPADANMKAFVYNPVNEKLMATLDENNFAIMYEYDQEGNLVRTKKETEKGVMTISESRSSNPAQ